MKFISLLPIILFLTHFQTRLQAQKFEIGIEPTMRMSQSSFFDYGAGGEKRLNRFSGDLFLTGSVRWKGALLSTGFFKTTHYVPLIVRGDPYFSIGEGFKPIINRFYFDNFPILIGVEQSKKKFRISLQAGAFIQSIRESRDVKLSGSEEVQYDGKKYKLNFTITNATGPLTPSASVAIGSDLDFFLFRKIALGVSAGMCIGQLSTITMYGYYNIEIDGIDTFGSKGIAFSKGDFFWVSLSGKYSF